jgi:hypothetical protein
MNCTFLFAVSTWKVRQQVTRILSSLHMAELNGQIPVTENPHFIDFDANAFGSD